MKMNWKPFEANWRKLPKERRDVLVKISTPVNDTGAVVVGYIRYSGSDKNNPFFVCGGVPGPWTVTHWCDCLGDDFVAPGWSLTNATDARSKTGVS